MTTHVRVRTPGQPTKWFDREKVQIEYPEETLWDGSNRVGKASLSPWEGQTLLKTGGGAWVLQTLLLRHPFTRSYRFLDREEAASWAEVAGYPGLAVDLRKTPKQRRPFWKEKTEVEVDDGS